MKTFIDLLSKGKTQFHLVRECQTLFENHGFNKLMLDDDWKLTPGGKYFVTPFSSMLVAFVYGINPHSVRIAAAHTDFPMLKLKPKAELTKLNCLQGNVEPYGGLITSTWFDRPLGLAGKVILQGDDTFSPSIQLFDSEKPIFTIPNLAPHLKKNTNQELDLAKEIIPIAGCSGASDTNTFLTDYIASKLNVKSTQILDYDLYLYVAEEPSCIGLRDEFISAPRIDNISSVAAIATALCNTDIQNCIGVGVFFDNEEIGSRSKEGADSVVLKDILDRIVPHRSFYTKGFNLSIDVAHSTHPNFIEKSDITTQILFDHGVALKTSASQRYVTDSEAAAVIIKLCQDNDIKLQKQANRTGMPGGQTLGPIMSSYLPMRSVDIGIPMLAMHSARELVHKNDYNELIKLVTKYFEY